MIKKNPYVSLFVAFLELNDALEAFLNNYDQGDDCTSDREYDFLTFAFTWVETPEGHGYWENLSEDWIGVVGNVDY